MNWNDPDYEEEYTTRKKSEADSGTGLLFTLAGFFLLFLAIAIVFGQFIYVGYSLSQKLWGIQGSKLQIWSFAIVFTYLIFCIIFFLKGIIIGLKAKNHKLWILPWLICVFLCCIIPAYITKSLVKGMFDFSRQQSLLCIGLSWGAFLFSSFYIYTIYQFKTPNAPRILYWSFKLGLKALR